MWPLKSGVASCSRMTSRTSRVFNSYTCSIQRGGVSGFGPVYWNVKVLKGSAPVLIESMVAYISFAFLQGAPTVEPCLIHVADHKLSPSTISAADDWRFT